MLKIVIKKKLVNMQRKIKVCQLRINSNSTSKAPCWVARNLQLLLTLIGNETMEDAKNSGQLEGWDQILEKVAAVIAGLAKAK